MSLLSRAKAMPLPEPEYPAVRLGINRDKLAFTADQLRAAREQIAAEGDEVIAERDATIAALRAEVERLERDAGRYRVLRSLLAGDAPMIRKAQRIIDSDYVWQMDEELDAAIAQTKERA